MERRAKGYGVLGPATASARVARGWSRLDEPDHDGFNPVALLLAMVLAVGVFDLGCTLSAYEHGQLIELNPLARSVLARYGSAGLAGYRFIMTALACVGLNWALRAYRLRYNLCNDIGRIRTVVRGSLALLVISHLALLVWWIAWLSA